MGLSLTKELGGKNVAIDVGSRTIKILKGSANKKGVVSVSECIVETTPAGLIENGYIRNEADFSAYLKGIVGKYGLAKANCYISVKCSDIVARELSVPAIKSMSQLNKLINNEILTTFGNTADYYIDYAITEMATVDYKNVYKVMAYAAPKELVANYFDILQVCDLKPAYFDAHRNVIIKLFKENIVINQETIDDKSFLLVDLGASYMDLDLIMNRASIFKRTIPISDDLSLSEDFDPGYEDYDTYNGSGSDAPGAGYEGYTSAEGIDDYMYGSKQNSKVSPIFSKVNEEVYKMIQFAVSRQGSKPVSKVYLYGGNAHIKGLDQYLATSLDISVEIISSMSNVELPSDANISDVMIAAGSFIRM